MGFAPSEIDRMSIWQFREACDGFAKANDPNAGNELTATEADELWEWVKPDSVH